MGGICSKGGLRLLLRQKVCTGPWRRVRQAVCLCAEGVWIENVGELAARKQQQRVRRMVAKERRLGMTCCKNEGAIMHVR